MSALRSRIIDKMDDILDLMDIKNRIFDEANDDEDFRPKIVECIKQIAELEATPPSQVRRTFERVEQNVRRLKQSIANLPPNLRDLIEVHGLDEVRKQVTSITKPDRKLLAADLTASLLYNYGGHIPSLFKEGPYIELASLMYLVATGTDADLENQCRKHFDDMKKEDLKLHSDKRGRRRSFVPNDRIKQIYERRAEAMKRWPTIEQVVDKVLGK